MVADEVVLVSFWASTFGLRVKIALAEKGVEHEYKEEDLFDKSSLLLQSNPIYKKVPVLIHNGRPICESLVIVQYIDECFCNKGPALLPCDPHQRANARFWAEFTNKIYEWGTKLWKNKGDDKGLAKEELKKCLKLLEGELGDKPFFGGDTFGYVDIALIPFSSRFYTYEIFSGFTIQKECPKLVTWVQRCMERDSVSNALPDPQKAYEFVRTVRKKLGLE